MNGAVNGFPRVRRRPWWLAVVPVLALPFLLRPGEPAAAGSPARRHVVEIRAMAVHPAVLEVARGDTVVWVNRDIVPHTATATGVAAWDTGTLAAGQDGLVIAGGAGAIAYVCVLHPVMRGRVIVRPATGAP